ncbi:hypothetical protein B7760_03427 [Burkholderia glumae]|nr:hypothetical protein B7760_03427 [Burkholderia glumae]
MDGATRAVERAVLQHEPFPVIGMDRHGNTPMTNPVARVSSVASSAWRRAAQHAAPVRGDTDDMRPALAGRRAWHSSARSPPTSIRPFRIAHFRPGLSGLEDGAQRLDGGDRAGAGRHPGQYDVSRFYDDASQRLGRHRDRRAARAKRRDWNTVARFVVRRVVPPRARWIRHRRGRAGGRTRWRERGVRRAETRQRRAEPRRKRRREMHRAPDARLDRPRIVGVSRRRAAGSGPDLPGADRREDGWTDAGDGRAEEVDRRRSTILKKPLEMAGLGFE